MGTDPHHRLVEPILYSFRRCPYAMRARMALAQSSIRCELREVVLSDKPQEMLEASSKATVPVLVLKSQILDESLDIMRWALAQSDPHRWISEDSRVVDATRSLVANNDGPFKYHLDRFKYSTRYDNVDVLRERELASEFVADLESRLSGQVYLFGSRPTFADVAIFPFIRQFAGADRGYWQGAPFPHVRRWLEQWCTSNLFARCMKKYPRWVPGAAPTPFPDDSARVE